MADTWFISKEWKARLVEFAGRRLLRNVANGETATYDVSRSEGQVSQEGDAFNTKNMNDFEQRVANGFANAKTAVDTLSRDLNSAFGYRTVGFDLNTLTTAIVWGEKFTNAPTDDYFMVISAGDHNTSIQLAQSLHDAQEMWHRSCGAGNWNGWTKKNGRSGTIAGAGAYWKDPPAGQYREWATGCVRWDEDNLVVTVEDDYEQGHLKVGAVVGKKGDTPNWGDKAGGLLVLKY